MIDKLKKSCHHGIENHYLKSIQQPVTCFITFKEEKYMTAALELSALTDEEDNGLELNNILGEKIEIQRAPEPSDIIWENR